MFIFSAAVPVFALAFAVGFAIGAVVCAIDFFCRNCKGKN